jgi:sporadic carbohydrate cluster protein (TIGR04323 family)
MNQVRGYIFSRSFLGERVPQHVQNLVIRDFCQKNNLQYLLSATEYAMEHCTLILEQVLDELKTIDGIVQYSLFQLPIDDSKRRGVYERVLSHGRKLFFAVEGLRIENEDDVARIETIWKVKKTLPHCHRAGENSWEN